MKRKNVRIVIKSIHDNLGVSYTFMAKKCNFKGSDKIWRFVANDDASTDTVRALLQFIYDCFDHDFLDKKVLKGMVMDNE